MELEGRARQEARRRADDQSPVEYAADLSRGEPEDTMLRRRIAAGLSTEELLQELGVGSNLRWYYRARIEALRSVQVPRQRQRPPAIATPEEAVAAKEAHGSERKAAKALGMSKTHLRRLLGKDG